MVKYGLIGKKIGHSFSANFFNEKFSREGIDARYFLFPLEKISEFPDLIKNNPELQGLNVTIPYKQDVMTYLDELSEAVRKIGAVNVIKFIRKDGRTLLKGFNSDYIGFQESLQPLLSDKIKSALILGTGGASKAVDYVLKNFGLKVTFVSRTPKEGQLSYDQLTSDVIENNPLIVNTTPLGMFPDVENYPPIPYQFLTPNHLCFDIIYNPEVTEFMKKAAKQGARVKNGQEMLIGQAVAAWNIWNSN